MAAGPTYEKIQTTTLTSDQNDIEFTSIPATYTDLIIVFSGSSTNTGSSSNGMRCRLNSDTNTNYSQTKLNGEGSSATSGRASSQTFFEGEIGQTSNTSPSINIFQIMSYSNTTTFKTILIRTSIPSTVVQAHVALYRSTSAISTVTLSRDFGTNQLKSGSTATLYGIKAA
jgi:hypothetical protein